MSRILTVSGSPRVPSRSAKLLDHVEWGTQYDWDMTGWVEGQAWELSSSLALPSENDAQASWCRSSSAIPGRANDFGSPGDENVDCP